MHKNIMELLKKLGLKDREGRIYLACLRHKDGLFIFEIAKATGTNRSTTDLTVRQLVRKGFINRIKVGRRTRYMAQSPEKLLFRQKQLTNDLEQVVPLLAQSMDGARDMEILYFEGAAGFREVMDDMLLNVKFASGHKKDLLSFSSGVEEIRLFPNIQKAFIEKRIKNRSWYRAIAPLSSQNIAEWISDPKELREVKYIPHGFPHFQIDMTIYADNVMLYSLVNPIGGAIIRNEKIANALRSIFSMTWSMLP